jgi:tetratricopeptide (TPR) repeat protein
MGFSPEQARVALAATDTGLDVQAALETLLSNGAGAAGYGHEMDAPRPPQTTRDTIHRERRRESASPSPDNPVSTVQPENILAQASGIGLSVLSKANAFWASGKELALKAYEERAKAAAAAGSATQPVRPKWMQDGLDAAESQSRLGRVDDGVSRTKEPGKSKPALPSQESKPRVPIASVSEPPAPAPAPAPDLFSDIPTAYVSPFRRSRPAPTVPSNEPSSSAASSRLPVLTQRKTISASPGAMATSDKHKASGTEKFKLGQYADAETAYSAAMEVLPDGHLLLVPLYNNRALTRLKNGDYAGAVQDCTAAITLIGPSYNPALESKVVAVEDGAQVDLGEGLVKAWKRRAEAWEGREKWAEARRDWEAVAGCAWAKGGLRGEGVRGAGRCRRLIEGAATEPATRGVVQPRKVPSRPRPAPAPRLPSQAPSISVTQFREAVDAQEAEDNARAELKDTVDAKLLAWKGGKETNIRALIASLDSVLWPELGLAKVGMGDLVSEKQVKIRYTKAIAKVHPDKVRSPFSHCQHLTSKWERLAGQDQYYIGTKNDRQWRVWDIE